MSRHTELLVPIVSAFALRTGAPMALHVAKWLADRYKLFPNPIIYKLLVAAAGELREFRLGNRFLAIYRMQ